MYSSFFACLYSLPDHPGAPVHGVSYYDYVGYFHSPTSSYMKSQLWGILCDDRNDVHWDYRDGICLQ